MMKHDFSNMPYALGEIVPYGAIAFYDRGRVDRVDYTMLRDRVLLIQERLSALGICRGSIVGIAGPNSIDWIEHDLALSAMGCIVVAFPETEFNDCNPDDIAEQFELDLLLITSVSALPARDWIASLDDRSSLDRARRRKATAGEITELASRHDVCSVIFSSGTSGQLKPIALSRSGVESVLDAFIDGYGICPSDWLYVALPMSVFQQRVLIYSAFRAGANIALTEPRSIFHGLAALTPTIVLAPPSLFDTFTMRSLDAGGLSKALGGNIRLLLTGSAPCPINTLAYFENAGIPLFQIYGMAEVGFISFNLPSYNRPGSVGRPILPGSVSIAPDGEIIVNMPLRQAIDYLGDARRNSTDVFLAAGRVATGDLGELDADGYLFITGRKKNIIVTRSGRKVPIETIEACLIDQVGVANALILGGDDLPWLVAVISLDPDLSEELAARTAASIAAVIDEYNAHTEQDAQIRKTIFTRTQFTPQNGLLTRNMKLDRAAIKLHFEDEL